MSPSCPLKAPHGLLLGQALKMLGLKGSLVLLHLETLVFSSKKLLQTVAPSRGIQITLKGSSGLGRCAELCQGSCSSSLSTDGPSVHGKAMMWGSCLRQPTPPLLPAPPPQRKGTRRSWIRTEGICPLLKRSGSIAKMAPFSLLPILLHLAKESGPVSLLFVG